MCLCFFWNSTIFVVVRSNFSYWFKIVNTHFVDCNNVWKCLWLNLEKKITGSVHLTKILRTCQIRFKKCTRDSDMPTDLAFIWCFISEKIMMMHGYHTAFYIDKASFEIFVSWQRNVRLAKVSDQLVTVADKLKGSKVKKIN